MNCDEDKYIHVNWLYEQFSYADIAIRLEENEHLLNNLTFSSHYGNSIFHEHALNYSVLSKILEQIGERDQMQYLMLLQKNYQNKSAVDIAIGKSNVKCMEIMLEKLSELPDLMLSDHFIDYYSKLMNLGIKSFDTFLETSFFRTR
jgi:hypothetical protein